MSHIQPIHALLQDYVQAFETGNATLLASLHWRDDPAFSAINHHIDRPFGRDVFDNVLEWMQYNQHHSRHMAFRQVHLHRIAPTVVYGTMLQEIATTKKSTNRVTFIFVEKDGIWKILHGHFSTMPQPQPIKHAQPM